MKLTGIFGGTFNPPHSEHIEICRRARQELGLDRIVLLPTSIPPHKSVGESDEDRLNMTRLCFSDEDVIIDLYEQEEPGVHYSVDTLRVMRERYGDTVFIIGGDSAIDFFKWRDPETLLRENKIAVCGRYGREAELDGAIDKMRKAGGEVIKLDFTGGNLSSTMLRYLFAIGADVSGYVPESVKSYVTEHGLYLSFENLKKQILEKIGPERYAHTLRTAKKALELNGVLNLPCDKVFLASMLHDVGKNEKIVGVPKNAVGTSVAHQFSGVEIARREFGVSDEEVLSAIGCHTTGKPGMSKLDKLVFVADLIEDGRNYPEADELRSAVRESFEDGFRLCLERQIKYLTDSGRDIYPLTLDTLKYYQND